MLTREITYIVQPGDTIYLIAKKFNTTVEAIGAASNLAVPALIYPGQTLRISVTGVEYVVQPGDTVYSIATKFGVPYYSLIYVNTILYPYTIYPGQTLFIPTMSNVTSNETVEEQGKAHPIQQPTQCLCRFFYTVRPGDSMFTIANMFGIPLDCLIRANPQIPDPSRIFPGQVLCIPASCPPTPPSPCRTFYTVRPGDSMFTIANMFGIPLDCLIRANPQIPDPSRIFPGQVLCIPASCPPTPPSPCRTFYTVRPGDSMFTIANMFGIPLDCLIRANPQIPDPSRIFPGQVLCIPASCPPTSSSSMSGSTHQGVEKSEETETERSE